MRHYVLLFAVAAFTALIPIGHVTAREVDLAGYWEPLDMEDFKTSYAGPDPVDFTGLPLNDAARTRALSYSSSQQSLPEHQCIYYPPHYLVTGAFGFRMSAESDPLSGNKTAWRISPWLDRAELTIWMDGRDAPSPEALHSFGGFTTGVWQGNTFTTRTTHFKEGPVRRNGVRTSDQASLTMHFTRHEEYLAVTALIEDPLYLTEPYILSRVYKLSPNAYLKNDMVMPCVPSTEDVMERGAVPHYLPGKNPFVDEFANRYDIPRAAALGGAATMYPEYREKLGGSDRQPGQMCDSYCCGWGDTRNPDFFIRYSALQCPGEKRTSPEVRDIVEKALSSRP